MIKNNKKISVLSHMLLLVFLLSSWEFLARLGVFNVNYTGLPSGILAKGVLTIFTRGFLNSAAESLTALSAGMFLGVIGGMVLGFIVGLNARFYKLLTPYVFIINTVPPIVLLPMIIIGLGVNIYSTIVIVLMMVLPVVLIGTADGVTRADDNLISMARSFRLSYFQIIKTIIAPSAVPGIMTGIKLSIGRAITGVIIAEYFGLGTGVGYLISRYGSTYKADEMMSLIILVAIFSVGLIKYFESLEGKTIKYYS